MYVCVYRFCVYVIICVHVRVYMMNDVAFILRIAIKSSVTYQCFSRRTQALQMYSWWLFKCLCIQGMYICIHFHLQGILKIVYGSTKINDCYCTLIVISHFHYILGICEAHNSVVWNKRLAHSLKLFWIFWWSTYNGKKPFYRVKKP